MNKRPEVTAQTRQKLLDSFWALAGEKNISQITVGDLARSAGYNRSTFYEYFKDMPDLIDQAENELLDQVREEFCDPAVNLLEVDLNQEMDAFYFLFRMLNEQMYCLLGPNGDPSFLSRVKEVVVPAISGFLGDAPDSGYFDYMVSFAVSALIGYLQHWHEQGQDLPEEEFYKLGYDLMTRGVIGVLAGFPHQEEEKKETASDCS